jgi:hypothetical protein
MRRALVVIAALVLIGPAMTPAAGAPRVREGPTKDRPNIILLTSVAGRLPADSTMASEFHGSVREAFEPDFYLTERPPGGPPQASTALTNRFRLVSGEPFGDEWQVQVWIDTCTARARDALPCLSVSVAILPPEWARAVKGPSRVKEELSFDLPPDLRPVWPSHVGRAAGLLVVESLHRRSGDLEADTRIRMAHTVRKPMEPARSTPAR